MEREQKFKKDGEVVSFDLIMTDIADELVNRYDKTLSTTKEYTKQYLDTPLGDKTLFDNGKYDITYSDYTPREMIKNAIREGTIAGMMTADEPIEPKSLGGRFINMFYGDFAYYLRYERLIPEEQFYEMYNEFQINCAQYVAFMATLINETMPELEPKMVFGDVKVVVDGVENKNRMDHFWLKLNNGIQLDNSGIMEDMYEDHRELMICSDFCQENPVWQITEEALGDGGWFNKDLEEKFYEWQINNANEEEQSTLHVQQI